MIYIIRHGQTVWNLEGKKQGRKDSPLTLKGIKQGQNIANYLKNENLINFQLVISPQWRCQQFASIICELVNKEFSDCILEEGLREHSFGLWEGKTEFEIENEFPGFLEKRYNPDNYWSYIVPMGESYELLSKRVEKVLEKYKNKNIIFVCHEMVSKVIRGHVLELSKEEILRSKHPQDVIYKINVKDKKIKNLNIKND